jgi:hypothetical protein
MGSLEKLDELPSVGLLHGFLTGEEAGEVVAGDDDT